ncbi:MAG: hypothetical protein C0602_11235 [Denitrovibrio sp.]|nr:MAG: hypothetical protein C0602_11235 [Denitrovibrio sp.]
MPGLEIGKFYSQILNVVTSNLKLSCDDKSLTELMRLVTELAEEEANRSISKEERDHMDCKEGCCICCRVHVPVLRPEALRIKHYLAENLNEQEQNELLAKMKKMCIEIRCLDEIERIFVNKKCVFLGSNGQCTIYPVRPLLCRSVTSADADACKESISMIALDQDRSIPMNIKQKSIYDTAFKALADGLDQYGISSKSREITGGVLLEIDPMKI